MGNVICCTTIERLVEAHEEAYHEPYGSLQGVVRELSTLTIFPPKT